MVRTVSLAVAGVALAASLVGAVDDRQIVMGDFCLNIAYGSKKEGSNVILWSCMAENERDHRLWDITDEGPIKSMLNDMCLDAAQSDDDTGNLEVWRCNGARNQKWSLRDNGLIRAFGKGNQCLRADRQEQSSKVRLVDCDPGDPNQVWRVQGQGRRVTKGGCYCKYSWQFGPNKLTYPDNCGDPGGMHVRCRGQAGGPPRVVGGAALSRASAWPAPALACSSARLPAAPDPPPPLPRCRASRGASRREAAASGSTGTRSGTAATWGTSL